MESNGIESDNGKWQQQKREQKLNRCRNWKKTFYEIKQNVKDDEPLPKSYSLRLSVK